MAIPQYKIFFDTSMYIAALINPKGPSGELISLAEAGIISMVVSEKVVVESDQILKRKFPNIVEKSRILWKSLKPEVVQNPHSSKVKPFKPG